MTYFILTTMFVFLGAYSIAAQIYFIRELLVIYFGNELCIGVIFAGWFAGIGCGAVLGARKTSRASSAMPEFLRCLVILCLLPFMLIPAMRMLHIFFDIPAGGYASIYHIMWGTGVTVCPFSFMVGFVFPLACRVLFEQGGKESINIGWVYIWESVGSLAGGLAISFLLIPRYPPLLVFGCGALLICLSALSVCMKLTDTRKYPVLKTVLVMLSVAGVIALASGAFSELDTYLLQIRWSSFNNRLKIIENRDSRYQNIVLAEAQGQYSLYVNGNFLSSYPDTYQAARKAHFFLVQHPNPRHVLIIGGGLTGLLREVLQHPVESVDYIEPDPELVRILRPYLNLQDTKALDDSRVTLFYSDGRRYIKETTKHYDVIIAETPDPSTALLNRFYTTDFFREIHAIMSPKGIFIIGISSTENYVSQEIADYNGSLFKGIASVFPFIMVVPGEKNYFIAAASDGVFSQNAQVLADRYTKRNIHSDNFSPTLFQWLVQKDRIAFMEKALKQRAPSLLNTDFHPITYFYNLIIWNSISSEGRTFQALLRLQESGLRWIIITVTCLFLIGCAGLRFFRPRKGFRYTCFWVMSTTGCAGMALELVLIFMFQSIFGYIYEQIGVVVALFMLGLASGGFGMRVWLQKARGAPLKNLMLLEILVCCYILSVPFMLHGFADVDSSTILLFPTQYVYFTLIFVIGLLVGMEFPLVCHVLISRGYEGRYVAGWVDALDHGGALFGAFLTGTILVPLWGMEYTCFLMGLLKLTCIGFIIYYGIRRDLQ